MLVMLILSILCNVGRNLRMQELSKASLKMEVHENLTSIMKSDTSLCSVRVGTPSKAPAKRVQTLWKQSKKQVSKFLGSNGIPGLGKKAGWPRVVLVNFLNSPARGVCDQNTVFINVGPKSAFGQNTVSKKDQENLLAELVVHEVTHYKIWRDGILGGTFKSQHIVLRLASEAWAYYRQAQFESRMYKAYANKPHSLASKINGLSEHQALVKLGRWVLEHKYDVYDLRDLKPNFLDKTRSHLEDLFAGSTLSTKHNEWFRNSQTPRENLRNCKATTAPKGGWVELKW
jgi:hypothetical protein